MTSKCGLCNSFRFELKEVSPTGSRYKFYFIQCSSCGNPVGITSYYDIHETITVDVKKLNSKIETLENKVDNLEYLLRQIVVKLR